MKLKDQVMFANLAIFGGWWWLIFRDFRYSTFCSAGAGVFVGELVLLPPDATGEEAEEQ